MKFKKLLDSCTMQSPEKEKTIKINDEDYITVKTAISDTRKILFISDWVTIADVQAKGFLALREYVGFSLCLIKHYTDVELDDDFYSNVEDSIATLENSGLLKRIEKSIRKEEIDFIKSGYESQKQLEIAVSNSLSSNIQNIVTSALEELKRNQEFINTLTSEENRDKLEEVGNYIKGVQKQKDELDTL